MSVIGNMPQIGSEVMIYTYMNVGGKMHFSYFRFLSDRDTLEVFKSISQSAA